MATTHPISSLLIHAEDGLKVEGSKLAVTSPGEHLPEPLDHARLSSSLRKCVLDLRFETVEDLALVDVRDCECAVAGFSGKSIESFSRDDALGTEVLHGLAWLYIEAEPNGFGFGFFGELGELCETKVLPSVVQAEQIRSEQSLAEQVREGLKIRFKLDEKTIGERG